MFTRFCFILLILHLLTVSTVLSQVNQENKEATSKMTFIDVYQRVFSTNCAVSSCHDGSFEPDFRTMQSAYYTLVYHPIVKNNFHNDFQYRVVPFDTSNSLLFERVTNCCFVNDGDQMPFSTENLSKDEIDAIASWILAGAPDWKGHIYKKVDKLPNINTELIVEGISENRDTLLISRDEEEYIRIIPDDINFLVFKFQASDDFTAQEQLTHAAVNFYSDANFKELVLKKKAYYKDDYWTVNINADEFDKLIRYYIQFEINDGVNLENSTLPSKDFTLLKIVWAFKFENSAQ